LGRYVAISREIPMRGPKRHVDQSVGIFSSPARRRGIASKLQHIPEFIANSRLAER
jgi:hypothetical protein